MNSNWIVYKLQAYFGRISNICKLNVWDSNSYISNIWKLNDKLTAGILSVHDFKQCYVLFVIYAIHQWCLPCSDEAIWSDLSLWGNHDLSLLSLNHARRFKTIPENQLIGQSWSRIRFIWKPSTHSSFTFLIPHSLFCPWALSAFSPFFSTDCHCFHCHQFIFSPPSSPPLPSGQSPPGSAWPMVFTRPSIHPPIRQSKPSMSSTSITSTSILK